MNRRFPRIVLPRICRPGGRARALAMLLWLAASTGPLLAQPATTAPDTPPELTDAQKQELAFFSKTLKDNSVPDARRKEAAALLLGKNWPRADDILLDILATPDPAGPGARLAVLDSLASTTLGSEDQRSYDRFVDPLLGLLGDGDESVRKAVARSLVIFRVRPAVLDRLRVLMLSPDTPAARRRTAVLAFAQMPPTSTSIDPLIRLLDDKDADLRSSALAALNQLVPIGLGNDVAAWKDFWANNSHKSPILWVNARLQYLTQESHQLRQLNAQIEKRLVESLSQLYQATPEPQQPDRVLAFLGDPLPAVRALALQLIDRMIGQGDKVPDALKKPAMDRLADDSPRVRAAAADVAPYLGDASALGEVTRQLGKESDPAARMMLVRALGRLRAPESVGLLISLLTKDDDRAVAGEAASALGLIAAKGRLDAAAVDPIAAALIARCKALQPTESDLREAVISAMADVGDPRFDPFLMAALADESASIRLAAARGLGNTAADAAARAKAAEALVQRLAAENDRGVRLAIIGSLGRMGPDRRRLDAIYLRTNTTNEPDESVRKRAWDVLIALVKASDKATELVWVRQLAASKDPAAPARLVDLLTAMEARSREEDWPAADRLAVLEQLADLLVAAGRSADAATRYDEIYHDLTVAKDARADVVGEKLFKALLGSDQAAKAIELWKARGGDGQAQALADDMTAYLDARLAGDDADPAAVMKLIDQIRAAVPQAQADPLAAKLKELAAKADRVAAQRLAVQVGKDLDLVVGQDAAVAAAARKRLAAMGASAVPALLDELEKAIASKDAAARARELAVVSLLGAPPVAASATDYDPAAPPDRKKQLLADYRKRWQDSLKSTGG
ncbi:MAG: hypothetical protein BIFFINMI_01151 [Phycisphaerae bacterium]|nr:hypothetical protein [Phycisphaerae bacterium]